jgi:hypothetical protein
MSGRITTLSTDGTTISQADMQRIEAEERLHAEQQRKAARAVAAGARDVDDCRMLLDMLGLDREVVAAARQAPATPTTASRRRSRAA